MVQVPSKVKMEQATVVGTHLGEGVGVTTTTTVVVVPAG